MKLINLQLFIQSTGITGTLTKGKSAGISELRSLSIYVCQYLFKLGTLPQDANLTLERGGMYKEGLLSSVDELISSTPSNYELKTDLNLVGNFTETESETKIDLSSVTHPLNADHAETIKVVDMPLPAQKNPCEEEDEVKSKEMNPTEDGFGTMCENNQEVK